MKTIVTLLALACALVAQAKAQENPLAGGVEAILARCDTDGNGQIGLEEIAALIDKMDGERAAAETAEALAAIDTSYRDLLSFELFLGADANDDLAATRDELQVFVELLSGDPEALSLSAADCEVLARQLIESTWLAICQKLGLEVNGAVALARFIELMVFDGDYTVERFHADFAQSDANGDAALDKLEVITFETLRHLWRFGVAGEGATATGGGSRSEFLYKAGRVITHKNITRMGADEIVSFTRQEVVAADARMATVRHSALDEDMTPLIDGMEMQLPNIADAHLRGSYSKEAGWTAETITVPAGTFECFRMEAMGTKTWMSAIYPGLVVKMESAMTAQVLVEFKD